jgi:hypothetical protein
VTLKKLSLNDSTRNGDNMSDETPKGGDASTQNSDPTQNIKAEFGRKIGNLESEVSKLAQTNQQLLAHIQQMAVTNKPAEPAKEDIEDLWYKDPRKAAAAIKNEAKREISEEMNRSSQAQAKQTQTLSQLVREYPELNDDSNPLTKKAVEIYQSMPEDEKSSPMAYKLAVKEAASELSVKPISKRSQEESDSYSVSGNSGSSYSPANTRKKKEDDIDQKTLEFAKLLGRPVDDPAYREKLKNLSKRKWSKYE